MIVELRIGEKYERNPFNGRKGPRSGIFNLPPDFIDRARKMVCFSYVRYINENGSFITFGKRGGQDVRVPGYAMGIMINKEVIIELNNTNGREINFDTGKLSDDHDNYENGKLPRIFFDRENKKFLGEFQSVNLITNDLNTHIKKIFEKNNLYAFRLKIRIGKKDNREVYAYEKI